MKSAYEKHQHFTGLGTKATTSCWMFQEQETELELDEQEAELEATQTEFHA